MIEQETRALTVRELMKRAIDHLLRRGFEEARLNVELLLAHALGCQRIQLYMNFEKPLAKEEIQNFRALYERRLNREPLQYITGNVGFMGLQLRVDQCVLIPRPETETLVEQTMLLCNRSTDQTISILEIGTGSGNIAVSLAKFVKHAAVTSLDVSGEALEVARLNVDAHGIRDRVTLLKLDVFQQIDRFFLRPFDLLVSNPPYVSAEDWDNLQPEIKLFEPRIATCDNRDGLTFYRRIVEIAPKILNDGGTVLVEVGMGQASTVAQLMTQAGFYDLRIVNDLQSVPRVAIGSCRAENRSGMSIN